MHTTRRHRPGKTERHRTTCRRLAAIGLVLLAAAAAGCSSSRSGPALPPPSVAHPLEGQIWDTEAQAFVSTEEFLDRALRARTVLLGEIHVNPEHHRIQADVVSHLAGNSAGPAVVFEMFEVDQQANIDRARETPGVEAGTIADVTGFRDSGWDWAMYGPLVETTLNLDLPLLAGNAPRATVRGIATGQSGALTAEQQARLDEPLPEPARAALVAELVEGHCGYLPPGMEPGLMAAQRLRDITMSDAIASAGERQTVLIAGSGHVRRDFGVPHYLPPDVPASAMLVVSLTEVAHGENDPAAYLPGDAGEPVYDLLWFTRRTQREDPCEAFREQLESMKNQLSAGPAGP